MLRRQAPDRIEQRLRRLERRMEDAEDAIATGMAPDRVDELADRVEELALTAVTHDDLLHMRTELARMAAEITRVRAELEAELDAVTDALDGLAGDSRRRRRAAG